MELKRLEKNIMDMLREEQLKLGYRSETVRLYYPLKSLNFFLKTNLDEEQMCAALKAFCIDVERRLGNIEISHRGDRFCLMIPPVGVDYVHTLYEKTGDMKKPEFLSDFIRTIEKHGCTLQDLKEQFYKYSDKVHEEIISNGEFDHLFYFEDGVPDDYRYCIKAEGAHITYHRFTPEDYEEL